MGKATGFLEYKRVDNNINAPLERIKDFNEFKCGLDEEERRRQGARCMNCGVAFCQSAIKYNGKLLGCPLHNLIPEWNDEVYNGNYTHALDRLLKTNNFPEFTGRVCPALCERACICGKYDAPVTVHENELFIIETAFSEGRVKPRIPALRSGKRVAVIGSGPAGLACADQLNHRGHSVTVYEKADRIGGLLMYGIPNMKLDKSIIERRVKLMEAEGIRFVTNTAVGLTGTGLEAVKAAAVNANADGAKTAEAALSDKNTETAESKAKAAAAAALGPGFISGADIMAQYDAVVLCCGAEIPRPLEAFENAKAEGKAVKGVYYAMDYLKAETKHLLDGTAEISAKGLKVIVVGAGDTANDCIGTAVRQGAVSVTQLIRRAKSADKKLIWPDYDEAAGLGYGQEEAIALYGKDIRVFETGVKSIKCGKDGSLTAVETVKLKRVNGKYEEVKGSKETMAADLLIIASGFAGCDKTVLRSFTGADEGIGNAAAGQCAVKSDAATAAVSIGAVREAAAKTDAGKNPAAKPDIVLPSGSEHKTNVPGLFVAGDMRIGASLVVRAIAEGRDCASQVDEYLLGYRVFERI